MYEIMGMMVAHSILLGSLCLSPCMYQCMCGHSEACYPTIDDIPLNLATYDLKFIEQAITPNESCYSDYQSNFCCLLA